MRDLDNRHSRLFFDDLLGKKVTVKQRSIAYLVKCDLSKQNPSSIYANYKYDKEQRQ